MSTMLGNPARICSRRTMTCSREVLLHSSALPLRVLYLHRVETAWSSELFPILSWVFSLCAFLCVSLVKINPVLLRHLEHPRHLEESLELPNFFPRGTTCSLSCLCYLMLGSEPKTPAAQEASLGHWYSTSPLKRQMNSEKQNREIYSV